MLKLLKRFAEFCRIGIIRALPSGMIADAAAIWGLLALMANVNAYSEGQLQAVTGAGTNSTLTVAQLLAGVIQFNTGYSGDFTITLPSTVAILAALGTTIPKDGTFSKKIILINNGTSQTGTLTAGDASTTVTGTATVATNTVRQFLLNVTSGSAVSFTNLGSLTL